MSTLDDLKARAERRASFPGGQVVTVSLKSDADAQSVVAHLEQYFGQDDERQAIRLVIEGQAVGNLARADLYDLVAMTSKGTDAAAGMILPGEAHFVLLAVCCRSPGCNERMWVMLFNDADIPPCASHPDIRMELCPGTR